MIVKFTTKESKILDKDLTIMEAKLHKKFDKFFANEAPEATVLYVRVVDRKRDYKMELTLTYLGYQLRAEVADSENQLAAFEKGTDILEGLIRKCKTKNARNLHEVIEFESTTTKYEEEPEEYLIVRTKQYEFKPMSIQEAILNMNMLGHSFYMFMNKDTNKLSTVYRRTENDYGLIESI